MSQLPQSCLKCLMIQLQSHLCCTKPRLDYCRNWGIVVGLSFVFFNQSKRFHTRIDTNPQQRWWQKFKGIWRGKRAKKQKRRFSKYPWILELSSVCALEMKPWVVAQIPLQCFPLALTARARDEWETPAKKPSMKSGSVFTLKPCIVAVLYAYVSYPFKGFLYWKLQHAI